MKAKLLIFTSAILLTVYSCSKRNQDDDVELDTRFSTNEAFAENTFSDINIIVDQAEESTVVVKKTDEGNDQLGNCAQVSKIKSNDTTFITVDFGSVNCVGNDGKSRRGKIKITLKSSFDKTDYWREVKTEGYFVNDHEIICDRKVIYISTLASGFKVFQIKMDAKIKFNGGGEITRVVDRKKTLIAGYNTAIRSDDEFTTEGSISGLLIDGRSFTLKTVTPLFKAANCDHFSKGILELQPDGKLLRTLDYGDGTCDNEVKIIVSNKTWVVKL